VYDVTAFLEDHPGGDDVLRDKAGQDATQAFEDIGHSPEAEQQMAKYAIGKLRGGKVAAANASGAAAAAAAAAARKTAGSATGSRDETPVWKKLIVPLVLIALAYGINAYFSAK
jgi:cytochrome b involved in lipid metabolism